MKRTFPLPKREKKTKDQIEKCDNRWDLITIWRLDVCVRRDAALQLRWQIFNTIAFDLGNKSHH